jgi:hypothetical protein
MVHPLPTITINGQKYFLDERLQEARHVEQPTERIPLVGMGGVQEYRYWHNELQAFVGRRVVAADLNREDEAWFPYLKLDDGVTIVLLSDEEGNGPGRISIVGEE